LRAYADWSEARSADGGQITVQSAPSAARDITYGGNLSDGANEIMRMLSDFGYGYDALQNVFYTRIDAWQRKYGYCALYDEGTAVSGMIIDSEPIYFIYNDNVYLLELWKGQYDLCLGAEIGLYRDSGAKLLGSRWFESIPDEMLPEISMILYESSGSKNGTEYTEVFERHEKNWWLTGFKLAKFAQPEDLILAARVRFSDTGMLLPFIEAAYKAGYSTSEAYVEDDSAVIVFSEPKQLQPLTRRTKAVTAPTQLKNKSLCKLFSDIAGGEDRNIFEILADAKANYPDVYAEAIKMARRAEAYTSRINDSEGLEKLLH